MSRRLPAFVHSELREHLAPPVTSVQRTYTVEFEMTDELADSIVQAVLADWKHFLRLLAQLARAPGVVALLLLLVVLLLRPEMPAAAIVTMAALLGVTAALIARLNVYRSARWAMLLPYYAGAPRTLQVTFAEDGITMDTAGLSGKHPWSAVSAVEVRQDLWLFRLRPDGHFAVPAAVLEPEVQAFLRRRAHEAGAAVNGGGTV
jgi:hypothetical protein